MALKALLVCACALFVQCTYSQLAPALTAAPLGLGLGVAPGLVNAGIGGCGCGGVASTGGGLPVASASPCAPVGVSVLSENAYEGRLCAGGNLPFLGSVAIDGVLPTGGAGAVSYGCGNGAVGIVNEGPINTGILAPTDFAPAAGLVNGIGPYGLGYGLNGIDGLAINGFGAGCGCGVIY